LFLVLALTFLWFGEMASAQSTPSDNCNGLALHANVGLTYIAGNAVDAQVGAVVFSGCSLWEGSVDVKVFNVNTTTNQQTLMTEFSVASGAAAISVSLGVLPIGLYTVDFVASADGFQDSATGSFGVLHAPCNYAFSWIWNAQGVATSFKFIPESACSWDISFSWNGGGFIVTEQSNGTPPLQNPPVDSITMPQNPTPAYISVNIVDQYHWANWDSCSSIAQAESAGGCSTPGFDNNALTSYPYAATSVFQVVEIGLMLLAFMGLLILMVHLPTSRKERMIRREEDFSP
jgi:hypothetical protein